MTNVELTYEQLDQILSSLGFSRRRIEPKWLCYEHAASGTEIILIEKSPASVVRVTDAVSARRHLIEKGLIIAAEFDRMAARHPAAPIMVSSPSRRK